MNPPPRMIILGCKFVVVAGGTGGGADDGDCVVA